MTDPCPCTTAPLSLQPPSTLRDSPRPSTYTQLPAPVQHEDSWPAPLLALLPQSLSPWKITAVTERQRSASQEQPRTATNSQSLIHFHIPLPHTHSASQSVTQAQRISQSLTLSFSFAPPVALTSPCSPEPQQNVRPIEHGAPSPCRASRVPRRAGIEMMRQRHPLATASHSSTTATITAMPWISDGADESNDGRPTDRSSTRIRPAMRLVLARLGCSCQFVLVRSQSLLPSSPPSKPHLLPLPSIAPSHPFPRSPDPALS